MPTDSKQDYERWMKDAAALIDKFDRLILQAQVVVFTRNVKNGINKRACQQALNTILKQQREIRALLKKCPLVKETKREIKWNFTTDANGIPIVNGKTCPVVNGEICMPRYWE